MEKAGQVVEAFMEAFPKCADYSERPSIQEVEELMRPFAPISYEVQQHIEGLFSQRGLDSISTGEHCWWEANFAVSGKGHRHDFTVSFLASDPCTCVIPHLEAAIEHTSNKEKIDPRLIALRDLWIRCERDELKFHQARG